MYKHMDVFEENFHTNTGFGSMPQQDRWVRFTYLYRQADEATNENSYEKLAKVDINEAANERKWSTKADEQTLNQTCQT